MKGMDRLGKMVVSGPLLVLAAAVLWGTTGTAQAFAPEGATPLSVGTVRLVVGGFALILLVRARGNLSNIRSYPTRPTLLASVAVAAYQLCFFAAVSRTGVAVGTIVGIGSAPVMAGLLEWMVYGRRPGGRWTLATTLALIGCVLLIVAGSRVEIDPLGVVLAMGAGFSYAVYTMASKVILPGRSPDAVMAVIFAGGAILLLPTLFFASHRWILEPAGLVVALHLGLVTVALAYILFGRGLATVPVSTTVTLTLAEPLTAAALGILILGERLSPAAAVGAGLLLAGLVVLARGYRGSGKDDAAEDYFSEPGGDAPDS
jgi:DME family drug/metabolite transporter